MLIIPQSWVTGLKQFSRQSLPLMLWRIFLLSAFTGLFIIAVSNGYAALVTVLGIVFTYIYADDIQQTWADLWNLNFWTPALAVAALVVLATVATPLAASSASAADVTTIDGDHPLMESSHIDEFESKGITNDSLVAPDMRLTVAESYDDADGLSGRPDYDPAFTYLGVEYNETITRTLRFYVPADYWYPAPQNIESEDGTMTAELRPSENATHTVVTIRVTGPTDAVFAIPRASSAIYVTRDMGRDVTENLTGIQLPRTGGAEPWRYLDDDALVGNKSTVGIVVEDRDYTLQYDPAGDGGERWLSVPPCDASVGSDSPICTFTRAGDDSRVYILAEERYDVEENPPPAIRYKFDAGFGAGVRSFVDGVMVTVNNAGSWVGSWFGGGN